MIELTAKGQSLDLPAGVTITFEIESDLFNFEKVEGAYSYTFDLPATPNNARVFRSPYLPEGNYDPFTEIPAELSFDGVTLFVGVVKLTEIKRDGFKAFFKATAGAMGSNRDRKLANLIDEPTTWETTAVTQLHLHYLGNDADPVFPTCLVNEIRCNVFSGTYSAAFPAIPMWSVKFWIEKIYSVLGYGVEWMFDTSIDRYNRLKIFNSQMFTAYLPPIAQAKLQAHAPDMTLSEFNQGIRGLGLFPSTLSSRKIVRLYRLKDILTSPEYSDMTAQTSPTPTIEPNSYEGLAFSWKQENVTSAFINKDIKWEDYTIISSVDDFPSLPDPISQAVNTACLVRRESTFYYVVEQNLVKSWFPLIKDYKTVEKAEAKKAIVNPFFPAFHRTYRYIYLYGYYMGDVSGKAAIYIQPITNALGLVEVGDEIKLKFSSAYGEEGWIPVLAVTSTYIRLDTDFRENVGLNNVDSQEKLEFTLRKPVSKQPAFGGGEDAPFNPYEIAGGDFGAFLFTPKPLPNQPFIFWWNGLQSSPANTVFASQSNYDYNDATQLQPFPIRLSESDGIVARFFAEFEAVEQTKKIVTYLVDLTFSDLHGFDAARKWRIDDMNYLPKRIKATLTHKGIQTATCELVPINIDPAVTPPPLIFHTVTIRYLTNCATTPVQLSQSTQEQAEGTTANYTLTAPTGYDMDSIEVDSSPVTVTNPNSQVLPITANADVLVEVCLVAEPPVTHTINVAYFGFTANPSADQSFPVTVNDNDDFIVNFTPAGSGPGYDIESIFVDTSDDSTVTGNTVEVFGINANVIIQVYGNL